MLLITHNTRPIPFHHSKKLPPHHNLIRTEQARSRPGPGWKPGKLLVDSGVGGWVVSQFVRARSYAIVPSPTKISRTLAVDDPRSYAAGWLWNRWCVVKMWCVFMNFYVLFNDSVCSDGLCVSYYVWERIEFGELRYFDNDVVGLCKWCCIWIFYFFYIFS